MDLYAQKDRNRRVTVALFVGVGLVIVALGGGLVFAFGVTDPYIMVGVGLVLAGILMAITWMIADRAVLRAAGARQPNENVQEEARLPDLVAGVATAAGLPNPEVYVIDDDSLNAFAVGRSPESGKVAFTTGLLHTLSRSETEAVAAHEVSHIAGRDSLIGVYTAVVLGFAIITARVLLRSVFFSGMTRGRSRGRSGGGGQIIMLVLALVVAVIAVAAAFVLQRAVSRKRESRADLSAVSLTNNPDAMISALEKIDKHHSPIDVGHGAASHLWIEEPGERDEEQQSFLDKLTNTHPPIPERIEALRQVAGEGRE